MAAAAPSGEAAVRAALAAEHAADDRLMQLGSTAAPAVEAAAGEVAAPPSAPGAAPAPAGATTASAFTPATCPANPLIALGLRNDTGAFRRLLSAAGPGWLEDPEAAVTVLAPTDFAMQRSALQVAAFAGPAADAASNSTEAAGASANAIAAAAAGGGGTGEEASAAQLVGVYVLPRPFSLAQLAALDEQRLETQTPGFALTVHAGPPAAPGVRRLRVATLHPPSCTLVQPLKRRCG